MGTGSQVATWQQAKQWSDRFLPEIKGLLGQLLIDEPPVEEDQERNTDLMVLRLAAVRIGCRVRRHKHLARYGGEFTIREGRPSGAKVELTKIIEGWGDYFFYGFSSEDEQKLVAWVLGDLSVFRLWFMRRLHSDKGKLPGIAKNNTDDRGSWFRAFNINDLPRDFVVGRQVAE